MTSNRFAPGWYQLVLDSVAEVVIVMDADARLIWANRTAQVVLGYEPEAEIGRNVLEWVHPDDLEETARLLALSLENGYSWPRDVRVRHANGSYVTMAVSDLDPMTEERDQYVVTLRHVQPHRASAAAADAELSAPLVVLHHVSDAVIAVGGDGQVIFRNRAAMELFRFGAARVMTPLPLGPVLAPVDRWDADAAEDPFVRVSRGDKVPRYESRVVFPEGSERLVEITGEPLTDRNGAPAGGVVAFRDVTELRHQEMELRQLALRDALTGLANRTELMAHLRAMLAECLLHGGHVVAMFVDLDRFKDINDSFDHLVGDEVLQATARRLVECAGNKGLVARFGGEEFVVVSVMDSAEADMLARRIVERVREPVPTVAGLLTTSCSVGLTAGGGTIEPEQLLREADSAVYTAKRRGGATVARRYDRSQRERSVHRIRAARQARSLADSIKEILYRPVVDTSTRRIVAVRAEVAEADRAVVSAQSSLDRRIVLAYVEHLAMLDGRLRERHGEAAPLVVLALPAQAMAQRALVDELADLLASIDLPPERRVIDVVSMEPSSAPDANLLATYSATCNTRLIVDDSKALVDSIINEQPLSLWAVRLKREFVRRLPTSKPAELHALRSIVDLASAHGAPIVADRVDRADQLLAVIEAGASIAWGDALESPMSKADLLTQDKF